MPEKETATKVSSVPMLKLPPSAKRLKCVRPKCGSEETWATYQHTHPNGTYTFELPAVGVKPDGVPYNMPCPNDGVQVWALYVRCGRCGYIGRVDLKNKKVLYLPQEEEAGPPSEVLLRAAGAEVPSA
jgi:hypothetical protein